MAMLQASLLDLGDTARLSSLATGRERTALSAGAWIEVRRNWITGSHEMFETLIEQVPWRAERREMYDSIVDVPRLTATYQTGADAPHPMIEQARVALSQHYLPELGEEFVSAGLCYYRDGRDSVAWHGDRIGRGRNRDTMVAIVSLGADRDLSLRPRGGGPSRKVTLGSGDLIVMGGSCQRTWDHAILKTARPVGPRLSIQFRPRAVW